MIHEKFYSANNDGKELTVHEVIDEMLKFIDEDGDFQYRVMVGTDSLYRAYGTVFATVIAIHRVGRGARFWWTKTKEEFEMNLSTRIMREAADSVELMQIVYDSELVMKVEEKDFSVHIDAGNDGDSKKVVNQCMGYVTALGFNCEVKPNSPVAVTVADRITK